MLVQFIEQVFFYIRTGPKCFYETIYVFNLERLIDDDRILFKHHQSFFQVQILSH